MCTRYVLLEKHYRAVLERLGIAPRAFPSRYNIAPSSEVPVIRSRVLPDAREEVTMQWGLVPRWAATKSQRVVNARADSIAEKSTFREALLSRRCVIPASGFYEWKTLGRIKQPWLVQPSDDGGFAFAGIWEPGPSIDGVAVETFAVITTDPNALMSPIHNRMPVILNSAQVDAWLDPARREPQNLSAMLTSHPASAMTAVPVTARMNSVRYEQPDCMVPVAMDEAENGPQLSLGF
jgi:putative SOS response-associated peptidase YedK